jgi:hypothetical protein
MIGRENRGDVFYPIVNSIILSRDKEITSLLIFPNFYLKT